MVVDWAGGLTDYSQGPFKMYLKSMTVTDYSTGISYSYGDKTGSWESIVANGGKVNGNSGAEPASTQSAPAVTATVDSVPVPWSGTHKETSTFVTPNVWPWVATDSPRASSSGFPSGWESSSGHIQPPGRGSVSERSPAPSNTSLGSITKTGPFFSQSTFRSTSVPLASSSAAFSRSGLESPWAEATRLATSATRHTTSTTSESTETRTTASKSDTSTMFTATASSTSHVAPSVGAGISLYNVPAILGASCALFGGIVALL